MPIVNDTNEQVQNNQINMASYLFGSQAGQSTGWRTNEWVANALGPGQTSALQIKTRSA